MQNATASDPFADEKIAWTKLDPIDREAVILYNNNLRSWESIVPNIMILEMLLIERRVPNFCSVLSVPERLLHKEKTCQK